MNRSKLLHLGLGLAAAACSLLTVACDEAATERDELFDADQAQEIPVERLALVEFDDGVEVEFVVTEDGHTVVSELAPLGTFSRIDYLVEAQPTATPLELFMALRPNLAPPVELVENHEERADEQGVDPTPRSLSLPLEGARAIGGDIEYSANCTRSSDLSWFKSVWQSAGWNWRWYYSGSATGPKYTPSKFTDTMYSHVCNHSVTDSAVGHPRLHHAATIGDHAVGGWTVPVGHRHLLWAGSYEDWGGYSYKWVDAPGKYRLGVMAP